MTRRPRFFSQRRDRNASDQDEAAVDHAIITRRLQSLERSGPLRAAFAVDYTPRLTSYGMPLATGRP